MARRDERGHVVQPVGVHLEPRRKGELDGGGEDDNDRGLYTYQRNLCCKQQQEQRPCHHAQQVLNGQRGVVIEKEGDRNPCDDQEGRTPLAHRDSLPHIHGPPLL